MLRNGRRSGAAAGRPAFRVEPAGVDVLLHEKAEQAQALLAETGLDCWLTFARETELHPDPGVEQVVGAGVVRNSAFVFGAGGERVAIVATFDTSAVRAKGVFREVVGYDEDIRGPLLAALGRLDSRRIGLNYSTDDVTADGLTHGQWLLLQQLLSGTPYLDRLTSAAALLARLRGRKSPAEIGRIRRAVAVTERIVALLNPEIRPGVSERDLAAFAHARSPTWARRRPGRPRGARSSIAVRRPTSATRTRRRRSASSRATWSISTWACAGTATARTSSGRGTCGGRANRPRRPTCGEPSTR